MTNYQLVNHLYYLAYQTLKDRYNNKYSVYESWSRAIRRWQDSQQKNANKITYIKLVVHAMYTKCNAHMRLVPTQVRSHQYLCQVYVFLPGSYAFREEMEQTKTLNRYLGRYKSYYEHESIPNKKDFRVPNKCILINTRTTISAVVIT